MRDIINKYLRDRIEIFIKKEFLYLKKVCQIWFDNVNIIYFMSVFVLCMFDVKGPRFFGISKIFASKKIVNFDKFICVICYII